MGLISLFFLNMISFNGEEMNLTFQMIIFTKLFYGKDPFVLAPQVHQAFYVQDPIEKN